MNCMWWFDSDNFSIFHQSTNQNIFGTDKILASFPVHRFYQFLLLYFLQKKMFPLCNQVDLHRHSHHKSKRRKTHCSFCVIRLPSSIILCFPVAVKNTMEHLVFKCLCCLVVLPYGSLIIDETQKHRKKN